jgi:hypothetical protein
MGCEKSSALGVHCKDLAIGHPVIDVAMHGQGIAAIARSRASHFLCAIAYEFDENSTQAPNLPPNLAPRQPVENKKIG